jgi:hypothetical protein
LSPGRALWAAGLVLSACFSVEALPELPDLEPSERSALLVVEGSGLQAQAFAFDAPAADDPPVPDFSVPGDVDYRWLTFACPLQDLGLPAGPQLLSPLEPGAPVQLPPPVRQFALANDAWTPTEDSPIDVLTRLPLDERDRCRTLGSRVAVSERAVRGGEGRDLVVRTLAGPVDERRALVLRWVEDQDPTVRVDGTSTATVVEVSTARFHVLDVGVPTPASNRVPELEDLPFRAIADGPNERLWLLGDGRVVELDWTTGDLPTRREVRQPALDGAQAIDAVLDADGSRVQGWLLVDTSPREVQEGTLSIDLRLVRVDGDDFEVVVDRRLPFDRTRVQQLVRLDEDTLLVRGLDDRPVDARLITGLDDPRPAELPRSIEDRAVFRVEGRAFAAPSSGGVLEWNGERFVSAERIEWRRLASRPPSAWLQGRWWFAGSDPLDGDDEQPVVAERTSDDTLCAVDGLPRERWRASTVLPEDTWILLDEGNAQGATVAVVRVEELGPFCEP